MNVSSLKQESICSITYLFFIPFLIRSPQSMFYTDRTRDGVSSASKINFRRGVFQTFYRDFRNLLPWRLRKLLPWRSQTFAVAFTNFCRGVYKPLPWRSQTFAVAFTNFCRGVHKLLPWRSQTFGVMFTKLCSGYRDLYFG